MTEAQLISLAKEKLGCNVTYLKADNDASLPYAVYSKTETFSGSDQHNYIKNVRMRIDLFTQSADYGCICEFDSSIPSEFMKTQEYISEHQLYLTSYEIEFSEIIK